MKVAQRTMLLWNPMMHVGQVTDKTSNTLSVYPEIRFVTVLAALAVGNREKTDPLPD